ncbi:mannose-6-phosphate isomerase, class I [Rosenbergiella metrosideri]|uniref:mannose-6-phosphate isomerase, class I n=1 Tax=Rosenbergiella metrosideri TaxID=2921185 RepID=UPI001F4FD02C|nr:mannose-6-phosphate isomerase, class I [Rosenbergiella metrosideri]
MYKLINQIQDYDWGCRNAISEFFSLKNHKNIPMAEIWMGAHPKLSSKILVDDELINLDEFILHNPVMALGEVNYKRFSRLPYLFKILAADKPLSIQVHPNLPAAKKGFLKENKIGLPLSSSFRNYQDDNHKPELIYALSKFSAMNGFRELKEISRFLSDLDLNISQTKEFIANPDFSKLESLFIYLLTLKEGVKVDYLSHLIKYSENRKYSPWKDITEISKYWPNDVGLFMPLLLNIIVLEPGDAMFLDACTPHAYLKGLGLEIMASSDNVLRAGLTNKHIDINELFSNVNFLSKPYDELLCNPVKYENFIKYQVPVDDFEMSILDVNGEYTVGNNNSPIIAFCLHGSIEFYDGINYIESNIGESIFIPARNLSFHVSGKGKLVLASVGNNEFTVDHN